MTKLKGWRCTKYPDQAPLAWPKGKLFDLMAEAYDVNHGHGEPDMFPPILPYAGALEPVKRRLTDE